MSIDGVNPTNNYAYGGIIHLMGHTNNYAYGGIICVMGHFLLKVRHVAKHDPQLTIIMSM